MGCLRLPSGFTHVVGAQIDYSWQGICFIGNCVNDVGTSSSLQKIAQQRDSPRHYPAAKESLPIVGISTNYSIYGRHSHAKLVTSEPVMVLGMGLSIFMGLSMLRPKTGGPMSVCHTLTKLHPPRHYKQWYFPFLIVITNWWSLKNVFYEISFSQCVKTTYIKEMSYK